MIISNQTNTSHHLCDRCGRSSTVALRSLSPWDVVFCTLFHRLLQTSTCSLTFREMACNRLAGALKPGGSYERSCGLQMACNALIWGIVDESDLPQTWEQLLSARQVEFRSQWAVARVRIGSTWQSLFTIPGSVDAAAHDTDGEVCPRFHAVSVKLPMARAARFVDDFRECQWSYS